MTQDSIDWPKLVTMDISSRQKYRRTKYGKVASRKWITLRAPRRRIR